ncbi:hypothetical protein EG68_03316 [Paragonimus skrjabini miyazakii]|uniref:Uncharacterized protein n=1 Tax=Paragonimus skrjabini miyazakii TaxID=59628 RepID=A0A8S9Z613_9TREM|nr:hypothetical protein EG68_03316 [Paragonimus skrjabini miyazakii]
MNSICLPITELQVSIVVQKNITVNVIINGIENVDEHVPRTLQIHVSHTCVCSPSCSRKYFGENSYKCERILHSRTLLIA